MEEKELNKNQESEQEKVENETQTFEFKREEKPSKMKKDNKLRTELAQKEEKIEELNQKYIRLQADFENFKKRNQATMLSSYSNGKNDILEDVFPIIDVIDMAITSIKNENERKGVELIKKAFQDVLSKNGVEEIVALGEEFDPKYHEAVMNRDDPENVGKILEVLRKGYKVGDKVLRHPMVVVGQ